jgi:hypothetical protein
LTSFFFDSSVRPKEYIRNFLAKESPDEPLADGEICELLKEKGINIARRTVAKYREELNIPPSFECSLNLAASDAYRSDCEYKLQRCIKLTEFGFVKYNLSMKGVT